MPTSRGRVTVAQPEPREDVVDAEFARRSAGRAKDAPIDPKDPLKGAVRFIARNEQNKAIKVRPLPLDMADEDDDERTRALIRHLRGAPLRFSRDGTTRDGALVTHVPAVYEWLRHRIARGMYRNVTEDLAMLDIPCPECDATFKNTQKGQAALGRHLLEHRTSKKAAPAEPAAA